MAYNDLNELEKEVIVNKGTERPFTGEYDNFFKPGTFICRRCNNPLFSAKAKFDAGCGWPAFDENFPHAIKRLPVPYGDYAEICCAHCGAHLGHVFEGEKFTKKDTRHCVNSISIKFIAEGKTFPKVLNK